MSEKPRPHTPKTTLKTHTEAQVKKMHSINKVMLLGLDSALPRVLEVQWARTVGIWDSKLMPCCPLDHGHVTLCSPGSDLELRDVKSIKTARSHSKKYS